MRAAMVLAAIALTTGCSVEAVETAETAPVEYFGKPAAQVAAPVARRLVVPRNSPQELVDGAIAAVQAWSRATKTAITIEYRETVPSCTEPTAWLPNEVYLSAVPYDVIEKVDPTASNEEGAWGYGIYRGNTGCAVVWENLAYSKRIVSHELGHALMHLGHNGSFPDVMSAKADVTGDTYDNAYIPTESDIAAIRK